MVKTYDYIVTIKPSKGVEAVDWISQLLLFIAVAATAYTAYGTTEPQTRTACIILAVLVIAKWVHSRVTATGYRIALLIAGIGWYFAFHHYLVTILYFLCSFFEKQVKFKQEIGFDDEGVTFNYFPKKHYPWHEVSNVILKDGMITVDLHNNKIFQKELESDISDAIEKEFNGFCRSHLFSFVPKS
jgi:hypothetical protein